MTDLTTVSHRLPLSPAPVPVCVSLPEGDTRHTHRSDRLPVEAVRDGTPLPPPVGANAEPGDLYGPPQ